MTRRPTPASKFVPMDEGLPPEDEPADFDPDAPAPDADAPITDPEAPAPDPDAPAPEEPPVDPEAPIAEVSAYDQAAAFEPDPWDQLPEDPQVRELYLALNGHINFFIKRKG